MQTTSEVVLVAVQESHWQPVFLSFSFPYATVVALAHHGSRGRGWHVLLDARERGVWEGERGPCLQSLILLRRARAGNLCLSRNTGTATTATNEAEEKRCRVEHWSLIVSVRQLRSVNVGLRR